MLSSLQDGDESLRLSGLRSFVNQYLSKPNLSNSPVESSHTSSTDYICALKNFVLSLLDKVFQLLVFLLIEFTLLILFIVKLDHFNVRARFQVLDLLMKR
jgi:hypothetical protein